MSIPGWYQLLLLAAASWRTFQLVADDDILDRPRRWALGLGSWKREGDPVPAGYRRKLGDFVTCPYCAGFWIAVAWWGAWQLEPKWVTISAVPFALSALLIGQAKILSPDED
jgi:hypothetical protein